MDKWEKFVYFNASKYGATVNEAIRDGVIMGLERNHMVHGLPLCPCKFYTNIDEEKETRDNVCPCLEIRETDHCHCNLFKKD